MENYDKSSDLDLLAAARQELLLAHIVRMINRVLFSYGAKSRPTEAAVEARIELERHYGKEAVRDWFGY
jgi:hypothetical protein